MISVVMGQGLETQLQEATGCSLRTFHQDLYSDVAGVLDFVTKEDFKTNLHTAHLQITEVNCLFVFETRSQCAAMELTLQTRLASNSQNIHLLLSPNAGNTIMPG